MNTLRFLLFWVRNLPTRLRGWRQEFQFWAKLGIRSELRARVLRADGSVLNLGVLSRRVITTAGVNALTDAFQGLGPLAANFRWHDSGTSNTAEAIGDVALGAPAGPARVSGTQTEGATNVYRTVATITYTTSQTIQEHGLFDASTAGVLLDRSVFVGVPVNNGDAIQFTYSLTLPAGG